MTNTVKVREPKSTGMRVIRIDRIPMSKIVSTKNSKNYAREKGLNSKKVIAYKNLILNGDYTPEYYEPPVVVIEGDTYRLVTGGHRHGGHVEAGATDFYCAVVEFYDCNEKSADYWELNYMSMENAPETKEVPKNVRTLGDVVCIVKTMVEKGIIDDSDESIQGAFSDLGFGKTTDTGKNLFIMFQHAIGKTSGVPTIFTTKEANDIAVHQESANNRVFARTMKDSSGRDSDYDKRLTSKILEELNSQDKDITALIHFTALTSSEILNARSVKRNLLKNEFEDYVKPYYEAYTSGDLLERVRIGFIPQLEQDKILF